MPINYQELGGAASSFGSAIGDFTTSAGDYASAGSFGQAAKASGVNAQEATAMGRLQTVANARSLYINLGAASAASAANGLKLEGSDADILRSSASQGALTQQMTESKANMETNAYLQQQQANLGKEASANSAAKGAAGAGVMGILSTVIGVIAAL